MMVPSNALRAAAGGEERLEMVVTTVTALTRPPEDHYYEDLLSRYGQMRPVPADVAPYSVLRRNRSWPPGPGRSHVPPPDRGAA
jgi:hypothetical protein